MTGRTAQLGGRPRRSSRIDEAALGLGVAIGAAGLAVASRYLARRAHRAAAEGLVDWPRAERIAVNRLAAAPGSLTRSELDAAAAHYEAAMAKVVPLLEQRLGLPLPGVVERHAVVSRAGWARANLVVFRQLIDRLESRLATPRDDRGFAAGVAKLANRFLTTQQIGFLLGFLGTRVLGQYDVALLSAEAKPGRLLFVDENVRGTAAALGVPLDDFRTWICLHEATHAFEFEANDWLRPYLAERIEAQLTGLLDQARSLQAEGAIAFLRRLRSAEHPLESLMQPEQRRLFRETQLVMSLLEGFSDWVMDEAGAEILPNVGTIRERFEARRGARRSGLERIVARLTGLDLKLEQYRRGEQFVAGVAALGGPAAVRLLWQGPESLPSADEMAQPRRWVQRMAPQLLAASA
ncbi:MAG TPA: zinc-dependent metalloprotease [Candidatus Limnocylindrales bacterium]